MIELGDLIHGLDGLLNDEEPRQDATDTPLFSVLNQELSSQNMETGEQASNYLVRPSQVVT